MRRAILVVLAALGAVLWFTPGTLLAPAGQFLVESEPPQPSDCALVLAGDFRGQRIVKGAELFRQGMAPTVFVSGPKGIYNNTEDQLAIAFARSAGYGDVRFIGIPIDAKSTVTEARATLPKLREAGCRKMLVVTSDFHTRRAGRVLRAEWPGMEVRMVAAPTDDFDASRWWTQRQYLKTFYMEWSKTIAYWAGL